MKRLKNVSVIIVVTLILSICLVPNVFAEELVNETNNVASFETIEDTEVTTTDDKEVTNNGTTTEAKANNDIAMANEVVTPVTTESNDDEETLKVAKIGDTEYATFDEALKSISNNSTIVLLDDISVDGIDLFRDTKKQNITVTIEGNNHNITFKNYGISLRYGNKLIFKNVNININGIGKTPAYAPNDFSWSWMTICAHPNSELTLINSNMTMNGQGTASNTHAIYFTGNNKLNLTNSTLIIKNYSQDALEWDGGDGGYNVNITNSTFISDHNRSGFTGTFYATIDNSKVDVINSTGNGSNGSNFIIKNGSIVNFNNNTDHGLSAGNLKIDNSTVNANDNGRNGIIFTGKGSFINSNVTITSTKGISYWNAGMRLMKANAELFIDKDSIIKITDNKVSGIFMDSNSHLTIENGANVLITRNIASQEKCTIKIDLAQSGGGIVVRSNAVAILSNSTQIYNNHAYHAGDDIFVEDGGKITFGNTGEGWRLDGDPDCTDSINGWYDDKADSRWEAHSENHTSDYIFKTDAGTYTGLLAIKAAHNNGKVIAHYISDEGKVLSDDTTLIDAVENEYKTEAKIIDKYTLIKVPENNQGKYTEKDINVYYVYKLTKGKVVAHYVDENGNKLADDVILEDILDKDYKTEKKDINGYIFISVEGNETGKFTEGTIEVTYTYTKAGTGETSGEITPPNTGVSTSNNNSLLVMLLTLISLVKFILMKY